MKARIPFLARIGAAHPDHGTIARSIGWVALFLLVGRFAGAIKEMAIAWRFGTGPEVDAYAWLLAIISWPAGLASSLLLGLVVPIAARIGRESPAQLRLFRAELLGVMIAISLCAGGALWVGLHYALQSGWAGLTPEATAIARDQLPLMIVLVPVGMVITLLAVWTMAGGHHRNTLAEGVPALVIAAALLLAGDTFIGVLVWATVAGYVIHIVALAWPLRAERSIEAPRFSYTSPQWAAFWGGFGLLLVSQAVFSSITVIDQLFAAGLGSGAVATHGYANRVLALIVSLGATAMGRATLPVFSRAAAAGDAHVRRMSMQWSALMFVAGAVGLLVTWMLAPLAIRLLFERGAFGADDTEAVATALRYGLIQLPFYFGAMVLVNYCASRQLWRRLFWSGILGFATKITANVLLVPVLGINGIALAWSIAFAVNAVYFLWVLRRPV